MLLDLEKICDDYYDILLSITELAEQRSEADARNLIAKRKEVANIMKNVELVVRKTLECYDFDEKTKDLFEEFRETFVAERKDIATHQSKWPAPQMQADRIGYENDIKLLFAKYENHHIWRKGEFIDGVKKAINKSELK